MSSMRKRAMSKRLTSRKYDYRVTKGLGSGVRVHHSIPVNGELGLTTKGSQARKKLARRVVQERQKLQQRYSHWK